jgi:glutathione S-transferase
VDIASFPALLRYLERVAQRPAYRRAMATAEPDLEPFVR